MTHANPVSLSALPAFAKVKAFAFDLDGTLVDSIKDLAMAANAMRAALGLDELPMEMLQSFVGDGMATLVHRALVGARDSLADDDLWQRGFALFARHYYEHIADYSAPYRGVADGIPLLKSLGFPVVVITNKSERFAVKLLADLGLADEFSLILGGDSLPEKKPSAQPLRHVCEVLNIEAAELAMVGDSHNDILAAKAAGSVAIGVDYGYENMDDLALDAATRPDAVIHTLTELYSAVQAVQAANNRA